MMAALFERIEAKTRMRQRDRVGALGARLRTMLGDAAVEAEEDRVVVSGRGILRRWLTDPQLRFLTGRDT